MAFYGREENRKNQNTNQKIIENKNNQTKKDWNRRSELRIYFFGSDHLIGSYDCCHRKSWNSCRLNKMISLNRRLGCKNKFHKKNIKTLRIASVSGGSFLIIMFNVITLYIARKLNWKYYERCASSLVTILFPVECVVWSPEADVKASRDLDFVAFRGK